jgi:rod shape-determining protein MreD
VNDPRRLIAATAAILTVLVVQATVLTPITMPLAVSLPAVLVAAVGIEAGPSAGMSIGFTAGLLADLDSRHPAGVLALVWLVLGVGCGLLANSRRRRTVTVLIVAVVAATIGTLTTIVLDVLHAPSGSVAPAFAHAFPSALGDLILALLVVPAVRVVVRALASRAVPVSAARSRVVVDG